MRICLLTRTYTVYSGLESRLQRKFDFTFHNKGGEPRSQSFGDPESVDRLIGDPVSRSTLQFAHFALSPSFCSRQITPRRQRPRADSSCTDEEIIVPATDARVKGRLTSVPPCRVTVRVDHSDRDDKFLPTEEYGSPEQHGPNTEPHGSAEQHGTCRTIPYRRYDSQEQPDSTSETFTPTARLLLHLLHLLTSTYILPVFWLSFTVLLKDRRCCSSQQLELARPSPQIDPCN